MYKLSPKTGTVRRVVYLHGGAYISEMFRGHWTLLAHLVKSGHVRCIVPIYPLGAALGAERVTGTVTDIPCVLIREVGELDTIIMGDSGSAQPGTC